MNDLSDRRYLKRSLGLSIGLHLLALPILIAVFWSAASDSYKSFGAATERERTTVSYLRIEHRAPPLVAPKRAPRAAAPPAALARYIAPVERPIVAHRAVLRANSAVVIVAVAAAHQPLASKHPAAVAETVPANVMPIPERVAPAPVAVATPTAAPSPEPSPSPSPVAEQPAAVDVPPGGWGQSFEHPLVADDAALGDLRTRYHVASHASIAVDETGKPTRVTLPAGISDDIRSQLERALMELRYVPAECNGLHCPGTLELML